MLSQNDILNTYLLQNSKSPFDYKAHEERFEHLHKHMLCGDMVGSFLAMLVQLVKPKAILEIGTMIGFSTICMANSLANGAVLDTIEIRSDDAERAKDNFCFFKVEQHIQQHIGDAIEIIPRIKKAWDFVFIDADKTSYKKYYETVFPFVKKNGNIVFDNMLFHNKVLDKNTLDKNAIALNEMNVILKNDDRVKNVLLPIRDGLQWVIKK